ncbi:entericidin A/B family lipoprotein [bacterium]|nr:entericidin A/B family lipoprotein [bacterium]
MRRMIIALALLLPVAACNTIEGVGKDLQKGGEVIADTAKDVKEGN